MRIPLRVNSALDVSAYRSAGAEADRVGPGTEPLDRRGLSWQKIIFTDRESGFPGSLSGLARGAASRAFGSVGAAENKPSEPE